MANQPAAGKSTALPHIYLDACVFLRYIDADKDTVGILDTLFDASKAGQLILATSVFSIAEVCFAGHEKYQGQLSQEIESKIEALWNQPQVLTMHEASRFVMNEARLIRRAAIASGTTAKVRGGDCVHLATAVRAKASHFFTYSKDIPKYADYVPFAILAPVAMGLPFQ